MARPPVSSLYVVQRVALHPAWWTPTAEFWSNGDNDTFPGVPVRGFASKRPADALCRALERQAREQTPLGPFLASIVFSQPTELALAAMAVNLPLSLAPTEPIPGVDVPSEPGDFGVPSIDSRLMGRLAKSWWTTVSPSITPEINAELWDRLLPNHRFYVVVRVLIPD